MHDRNTISTRDQRTMHTRRILGLALGVTLAAASPGAAADLGAGGYKDAGYAEAPVNYWHGPYVGAVIGVGGAGLGIQDAASDNPHVGGNSVTGGVLIGYNFRSGPWVGGFEADVSAMGVDETKNLTGYGDVNISSNWYGTARLRAGVVWDRALFYVTGGLGAAQWEMKAPDSTKQTVGSISPSFGLGVEYAFDQNWAMRVEALGVAGGSAKIDVNGAKQDVDFGASTIRVGLSRRF
jgi:outer membrane immunogenic protein